MPITQRESHSAGDRKRGRARSDPPSYLEDHRPAGYDVGY